MAFFKVVLEIESTSFMDNIILKQSSQSNRDTPYYNASI